MGVLVGFRRWLARLSSGHRPPPATTRPGPGDSGASTTTGPAPSGDGGGRSGGRVEGRPTSSNRASSFHLFWDLPGELVAVAATLEVRRAPTVDELYFWALQASFSQAGRRAGAGHLGLQFHPDCPDRTAANWGGYDERGTVLDGSVSALPSSLGNPHTRDFAWRAGHRYRLSIALAPPADQPDGARTAWRGTITDLGTGASAGTGTGPATGGGAGPLTVVRDLLARGDRLTQPMVWAEVFARCEHPSAEVRWSGLEGITADGVVVRPAAVSVNYQTHADGGCANTSSWLEGDELVQRTATTRTTPGGTRIELLADGGTGPTG